MKNKPFNNMGLCFSRKKLAWTENGFGSKWIHRSILKFIAHMWNFVLCKVYGHFWFSYKSNYETCCDCSKKRKRKWMNKL